MTFEILEFQGKRLAEVLFADISNESTQFYSRPDASLQLGMMSHPSGFVEKAHSHPEINRNPTPTQQAFVVISGEVDVDFFDNSGELIKTFSLEAGDSILIIDGIHRIRVIRSSRCVTIKQGPYIQELDKLEVNF